MTLSELQHLLERCAQSHLACVGDVMLDRYVYGTVERTSPEAPIPVMSRAHENTMVGGAGNVARNLSALGARVTLVGVVGADQPGDDLLTLVRGEVGLTPNLTIDPARPTTVKTRFVAAGQQLLRLDQESAEPVAKAAEQALRQAVQAAAHGASVVLMSDYAKGALTKGVIAACLKGAAVKGIPVIVDPKGLNFLKYGAVDLIKPNARELSAVSRLPTESDKEVERALAKAIQGCTAKAILVTRAGAGMSLLVRGEPVRHYRGRVRQVFDVSGAGDTALAALGAALSTGAELGQAVEFALLAAGVVVGKVGTAVVTPGDLIEAETALHVRGQEIKIVSTEGVLTQVSRWRGQGLKVGLTNGCFDILHRGHVAYLAEARSVCDRLIVALNTDESVHALKGPGRPVNDLESRALVMASLASVDLVVPFDAPTPMALIEAIKPDVLFKGSDYTVETVVGSDFVKANGGEVVLVPLVQGYSTTAAIKKMQGQP